MRGDVMPPAPIATLVDGLPAAIDTVAAAAAPTHRFLRRGWYHAAIAAYGGTARTMLVTAGGTPVAALPIVPLGPRPARLATIPGSYWPFRSFPLAADSDDAVLDALLVILAQTVRALRIGPVYDGDAAAARLIALARARGWSVLDRFVADSWLLDLAAAQAQGWPRNSTLRKNRFHEKHLAEHGSLAWRFLDGADWPAGFDLLADVEQASWIAARTDGSDAKFTATGHGAFWRAAAADPALAAMFRAALLTIDGRPVAFSFDLDAGALRYAIANSYDPAYARHSPGKLLSYRNLVAALGRGVTRVDWGAGDSGYKRVIGAEQGPAIRDWLLLRPGAARWVRPLLALARRRSARD